MATACLTWSCLHPVYMWGSDSIPLTHLPSTLSSTPRWTAQPTVTPAVNTESLDIPHWSCSEMEKCLATMTVPGPQVRVTCACVCVFWKLLITPDYPLLSVPPPIDGIVSTLKKQAGPASVLLQDEKQLNDLISGTDAVVVGGFLWFLFLWEKWVEPVGTWGTVVN